jgi:hypothetical protein
VLKQKTRLVKLRDGTDEVIKTELYGEIENLKKQYQVVRDYLLGKETDQLEAIGTLQRLRDTLSKISMHILTLYTVEGQKTKITWDSLLTNINHALENLQRPSHPDSKQTIQIALDISEPKIEEVITYLLELKKSLQ